MLSEFPTKQKSFYTLHRWLLQSEFFSLPPPSSFKNVQQKELPKHHHFTKWKSHHQGSQVPRQEDCLY